MVVNAGPNIALATNLDLSVSDFRKYHEGVPEYTDYGLETCQTKNTITRTQFNALKPLKLDPLVVFSKGYRPA
jgi:hypothetical protein